MRNWVMVLGLWGCAGGSDSIGEGTTPPSGTSGGAAGGGPGCTADVSKVTFATEDGETLAADHHVAATPGSGAVILFHMIPPSNDRSGYPKRVRDALADLGVSVLNVDRRGAGRSTGDPAAAYTGEGGRLDMEAAVRYLLDPDAGCSVDPSRLLLVGASNGSTSVHDYTAAHAGDLPDPRALVWMSPGTYTEAQVAVSGSATEQTPLLWLYPTNEPYSDAFVGQAADWEFTQRGAVHGTQMFDGSALEDDTVADVAAWTERWLL
ncbi:MAG: alpha/beta superfamily hydrolase [Myxococcota bacterium]